MKYKTVKAIITNDLYIPINRVCEITWKKGDIDNAYIDGLDGLESSVGVIKNIELHKYFREFIKPSREEVYSSLTDLLTRSLTGEVVYHVEADKYNAPNWTMIYRMTDSIPSITQQ